MSIHAERGDKIAVEVKDWGTYMSVTVTFGRNSIAMYPKEHEGSLGAVGVPPMLWPSRRSAARPGPCGAKASSVSI